jgi:hypothetical protein
MHAMARALLEWETIDTEQIDDIMAGREPRPPKDWTPRTPPAGRRRPGRDSGGEDRPDAHGSLIIVQAFPRLQGAQSRGLAPRFVLFPCSGKPPASRVDLTRPQVMGIVNVTPDSFSDGGRHRRACPRRCVTASCWLQDGAHILDIGGESTRPGAPPVPLAEELARVVPLVREAIRLGVPDLCGYLQTRGHAEPCWIWGPTSSMTSGRWVSRARRMSWRGIRRAASA